MKHRKRDKIKPQRRRGKRFKTLLTAFENGEITTTLAKAKVIKKRLTGC